MSDLIGTTGIITICADLDRMAVAAYDSFAVTPEQGTHEREFWKRMTAEERGHVAIWERMHAMALQGDIPELFDDADEIAGELLDRKAKLEALVAEYRSEPTAEGAMTAALCLEFYMVHSSLAALFQFWDSVNPGASTLDHYERHLAGFIDEFCAVGSHSRQWGLFADVLRQLWRQTRTLAAISMIDELTGVLNRRGFLHAAVPLASLSQRAAARVAVIMADVDDFKRINDTHGHQTGDEVLRIVGRELRSSIRSSDVAGRYGGEEFIVLLTNVQLGAATAIAETIRSRIESATGSVVRSTISAGVCEGLAGPDAEKGILSMIKRADEALYRAKRSGKNRVVVVA